MTSERREPPSRRRWFRLAAALTGSLVLAAGLAAAVVFFVLGGSEDEAKRVARASDAVNAAMEDGDFESLHLMLASEVQQSSSPENLRDRFTEAASTLGTVLNVERVGEPVVEGETAVVETEITYDMAGETSTKAFYDLFVLEDGEWRIVYSQPRGE